MGEKSKLKLNLADLNVDALIYQYGREFSERVLARAQEIAIESHCAQITDFHVRKAASEINEKLNSDLSVGLDAVQEIDRIKYRIQDTLFLDSKAIAIQAGAKTVTAEHVKEAIAKRHLESFAT